ncbi:hypothetical protein TNCV_3996701 [Trichonephila clavipes]|nr:hypothetical protein TNCV_3996701 [Trichonephila clavipes]
MQRTMAECRKEGRGLDMPRCNITRINCFGLLNVRWHFVTLLIKTNGEALNAQAFAKGFVPKQRVGSAVTDIVFRVQRHFPPCLLLFFCPWERMREVIYTAWNSKGNKSHFVPLE